LAGKPCLFIFRTRFEGVEASTKALNDDKLKKIWRKTMVSLVLLCWNTFAWHTTPYMAVFDLSLSLINVSQLTSCTRANHFDWTAVPLPAPQFREEIDPHTTNRNW
jgi:hypothetical protein